MAGIHDRKMTILGGVASKGRSNNVKQDWMAAPNRFTIRLKVSDVAASNGIPLDANRKVFQAKMQPSNPIRLVL